MCPAQACTSTARPSVARVAKWGTRNGDRQLGRGNQRPTPRAPPAGVSPTAGSITLARTCLPIQAWVSMGSDSAARNAPSRAHPRTLLHAVRADDRLWALHARQTRRTRPVCGAARAQGDRGRWGGAAHLPGMVAAMTALPVIGVPVKGSSLDGFYSLHSPSVVAVISLARTVGADPGGDRRYQQRNKRGAAHCAYYFD
jgi:hypothetical protein